MYEFQAKIRYSETDSNGNLSLLGLLNYFQDSSIFHSDSLGAGVEALKDQGMFWALSAWQIVVKRYPKVCETVTVGTAPYEFKGFMGNRNFWMKDENGEMIAWANSIWSLVDIQSGMPKKCPPEIQEIYKLSPKLDMEYAPRRIQFEGDPVREEKIEVVKHHLDTNMHVNNGQFVDIAMDFLPMDFSVGQLRVEYKMQAHLGMMLYPAVYCGQDKIGVALLNEADKVYCNVEFTKKEDGKTC